MQVLKPLGPRPVQFAPNEAKQAMIDARCNAFVRDIPLASLGAMLEYIGGHDDYEAMRAIKGLFPAKLGMASDRAVIELVRGLKVHKDRIPSEAIKDLAEDWIESGKPVEEKTGWPILKSEANHASKYIKGQVKYRAECMERGGYEPGDSIADLEKEIRKAERALNREMKIALKRPLTQAQVTAVEKRRQTNILMKMMGGLFR